MYYIVKVLKPDELEPHSRTPLQVLIVSLRIACARQWCRRPTYAYMTTCLLANLYPCRSLIVAADQSFATANPIRGAFTDSAAALSSTWCALLRRCPAPDARCYALPKTVVCCRALSSAVERQHVTLSILMRTKK